MRLRFGRRARWVMIGAAAFLLPGAVLVYVNHRKEALIRDVGASGASVGLEPMIPQRHWPTLARFGIYAYKLPPLFWRPESARFPTGPVTSEQTRRLVGAANRLGGIRSLDFSMHEQFDTDALAPLQGLRDLEDLNVEFCGLTDDDLIAVAQLRQLRKLNLDGNTEVTAQGVRHLTSLPRLARLSLVSTNFRGGDVISILRVMPALKEVRLGGFTEVPPEEVRKLQEALPGIAVSLHSSGQSVPAWH